MKVGAHAKVMKGARAFFPHLSFVLCLSFWGVRMGGGKVTYNTMGF